MYIYMCMCLSVLSMCNPLSFRTRRPPPLRGYPLRAYLYIYIYIYIYVYIQTYSIHLHVYIHIYLDTPRHVCSLNVQSFVP